MQWFLTSLLVLLHTDVNFAGDVANAALGKHAWQTNVHQSYPKAQASLVVDGNRNTNWKKGICAHTEDNIQNPYWMVDLGQAYRIINVTVYPRTDFGRERMNDAQLYIGTSESNLIKLGNQPGILPSPYVFTFGKLIKGRYVKLQTQGGDDNALMLCEVEVFVAVECSSDKNYCWPGSCGNNLVRNCHCSSNFKPIKTETEMTCQPVQKPTIETCRTMVSSGTLKLASQTSGLSQSCSNQQDFYGNLRIDGVTVDLLADYTIDASAFPKQPNFVKDYVFGVTDVVIDIMKQSVSGVNSKVQSRTLLDSWKDLVTPNATYSKKLTIDILPELKDGERLCLNYKIKGGGYLTAIDIKNASLPERKVQYQKQETSRSLCYRFDNTPPRHCSEIPTCTTEPIQLERRIYTTSTISLNVTGWHDPIPMRGTSEHESGIKSFLLTAHEVSGTSSLLKVKLENALSETYMPNDTHVHISLPLTQPTLYCLNLEVVDVALNVRHARRFVLIDNSSSIDIRTDKPLLVSSASAVTGFKWQTHHNKVCLNWKDHFYNNFYRDNALLSRIESDPSGKINGVYEQNTGILPVSGTPNVYGITSFSFYSQLKGFNESREIVVPDLKSQLFCKDLNVQDGQSYTLTIKSTDIIGNTRLENTTLNIDRSVPNLNNIWLMKDGHSQLFVHNSKDLSTMELYFEAMDIHSGIQNVEVTFSSGIGTGLTELLTQAIGTTDVIGNGSCYTCYCPQIGTCQQFNYSMNLNGLVNINKNTGNHNRNYFFSIKATNKALLSSVEHLDILVDDSPPDTGVVFEGPKGSPDIDYTSGTDVIAHWHGFIDHESGIKLYRVGLAERCLSKEELFIWKEDANGSYIQIHETTEEQITLRFNLTGRRYVSVLAVNNAMDPSSAACSDGITFDHTPPVFENVSIENAKWEETLACFDKKIWLFETALSKLEIQGTSSCSQLCNKSEEAVIAAALRSSAKHETDNSISEFLCDTVPIYTNDTVVYLPTDVLYLKWNINEDLSQVQDFYVGLGFSRSEINDPQLLKYTSTNKKPYFKRRHTGVDSNVLFFVFLKAVSKAHMENVLTFGPVLIDITPPECKNTSDIEITTDKEYLQISWKNTTFYDLEQATPMQQIYFQIESDGSMVSPVLQWDLKSSKRCLGISGGCIKYPLKNIQKHDTETGRNFLIHLYVYNSAGHSLHIKTNEFKVPSKYPPGSAVVYDIDPSSRNTNTDVDFHFSPKQVCAAWKGFNHHENVTMEMGVGSSETVVDVLPYQEVSGGSMKCMKSDKIGSGNTYYTHIRATCSGGQSVSTSDGVSVYSYDDMRRSINVYIGDDCLKEDVLFEKTYNKLFIANISIDLDFEVVTGKPYELTLTGENITSIVSANTSFSVAQQYAEGNLKIINVWSTGSKFGTLMVKSSGMGIIEKAIVKDCRSNIKYQSSSRTLASHWTKDASFAKVPMKHEVAIFEQLCNDSSFDRCLRLKIPYQPSDSNLTKVFRGQNFQQGNAYKAAVRTCLSGSCTEPSFSNTVIIDSVPPIGGNIEATLEKFTGTCYHFRLMWKEFESISDIVLYQWAIQRGEQQFMFVTPWRTVLPFKGRQMQVSRCLRLHMENYRSLKFCVRAFSESGLEGKECSSITLSPTAFTENKGTVYDVNLASDNWSQTKRWIDSQNIGPQMSHLLEMEMDFATQNTTVGAFVLYSSLRKLKWFLMSKPRVPPLCSRDAECLMEKETDSGFVEFGKFDEHSHKDKPLFICAYSKGENVTRELSTETLSELKSCSNGFIIDFMAPVAGSVKIQSPSPYLTDSRTIVSTWSGFSDSTNTAELGYDSAIQHYSYMIGTSPGKADIRNSTSVGLSTTAVATDMLLKDGTVVYVTVTANDYVHQTATSISPPFIVDTTGPIVGPVLISNLHWKFLPEPKIEVHMHGFHDEESGIAYFLISVGSTGNGVFHSSVVHEERTSLSAISLKDGHEYFLSVQAVNRAGLTSEMVSVSFVADFSEPHGGVVQDGASMDVDYQTETTFITGNWYGFDDQHSGIQYYRVGLGSRPFLHDIEPLVDVALEQEIKWTSSFEVGIKYFIMVEACNGADLCHPVTSDGITIDNSPPIQGLVRTGGSGHSHRYLPSRTSLHMEWIGFEDPQSEIENFSACIGTGPFQCDTLVPFNCLLSSSIVKTNLALPIDTKLYITVTAKDRANLTTSQVSDWFMVDPTPPVLVSKPVFFKDFNNIDGFVAQWERSVIRMTWNFTDKESPLTKHVVSLFTHHEGHTPVEHIEVGAENKLTINLPFDNTLLNGDTYRFMVTACNLAGHCTSETSDHLLIDSTPPHTGGFKPPMYWSNTIASVGKVSSKIHLTWYGFEDPESDIKTYLLTVSRNFSNNELSKGTISVPKNGDEMNATIDLTDALKHGDKIILSIWAKNNAGLESNIARTTVTVVSTFNAVVLSAEKGLLEIEKHSCDIHFCNNDCTCAIVGKPCSDVHINRTCNVSPQNSVKINVYGGLKGNMSHVTASSTCISGHWEVDFKTLSNITIHRYEWSIGLSNRPVGYGIFNKSEIPWKDVGLRQYVVYSMNHNHGLEHSKKYTIYVKAWFGPDTYKVYKSENILVDHTPPSVRRGKAIKDTDGGCGFDMDIVTIGMPITACWDDTFTEQQTAIVYFVASLGTEKGAADVLPRINTNLSTRLTVSNMSLLTYGTRYYFTVTAYNEVGLHFTASSDGFMIDVTAPTSGVLFNTYNYRDQSFQPSNTTIGLSWIGFADQHSGIKVYHVAVRECYTNRIVIEHIALGTENRYITTRAPLMNGKSYCGSLQAEDTAGHLSSEVKSPPIVIDDTPPITFTCLAYDTELNSSLTVIADEGIHETVPLEKNSIYKIHGNIENQDDELLLMLEIEGFKIILPKTVNDEGSLEFEYHFLSPVEADTNMTIEITSISNSQPTVALYLDRCRNVVENVNRKLPIQQIGPDSLSVIVPAMDKESSIYKVLVGAGSSPGGFQIQPLKPVNRRINGVMTLVVPHGTPVYVSAVVENHAGLTTTLMSEPITFDLTPPDITNLVFIIEETVKINPSANETVPVIFTSTWNATDPKSGVKICLCAHGTEPGSTNLSPFKQSESTESCSFFTTSLQHGSYIYVTVKCTNQVGLASEVVSSPLVVSTKEPCSSSASIHFIPINENTWPGVSASSIQSNTSILQFTWHDFNDESGIAVYEYKIKENNSTMIDWTNAGHQRVAVINHLELKDGSTYRALVRAINKGGLRSQPVYSDITVDNRGPKLTGIPITVTRSNDNLKLDWSDVFVTTKEIGRHFMLSVGSLQDQSDIADVLYTRDTTFEVLLSQSHPESKEILEAFVVVNCILDNGLSLTYRKNTKV